MRSASTSSSSPRRTRCNAMPGAPRSPAAPASETWSSPTGSPATATWPTRCTNGRSPACAAPPGPGSSTTPSAPAARTTTRPCGPSATAGSRCSGIASPTASPTTRPSTSPTATRPSPRPQRQRPDLPQPIMKVTQDHGRRGLTEDVSTLTPGRPAPHRQLCGNRRKTPPPQVTSPARALDRPGPLTDKHHRRPSRARRRPQR